MLVRSTDAAGNVSLDSNANTFVVDSVAPAAPVVVTPADGSTTNDTTPTVSGTAEPNASVQVCVDGAVVGTVPAGTDGTWTIDAPTLTEGVHTASARATDAAGNVSPTSNTVRFTVDSVAPAAPVITTPADGSVTNDPTPPIRGTAEPGSRVEVFVDGLSVGTDTAGATGRFSVTPTTAAHRRPARRDRDRHRRRHQPVAGQRAGDVPGRHGRSGRAGHHRAGGRQRDERHHADDQRHRRPGRAGGGLRRRHERRHDDGDPAGRLRRHPGHRARRRPARRPRDRDRRRGQRLGAQRPRAASPSTSAAPGAPGDHRAGRTAARPTTRPRRSAAPRSRVRRSMVSVDGRAGRHDHRHARRDLHGRSRPPRWATARTTPPRWRPTRPATSRRSAPRCASRSTRWRRPPRS